MSKHVESFFKDLASGMSRRDAFRRLFGGTVAAVAAVFTGRGTARADNFCLDWCNSQTESDPGFFGQCMAHSLKCPPGSCAINYLCSSGGRGPQCRDDDNWVCFELN